jgi:hypothetical protein
MRARPARITKFWTTSGDCIGLPHGTLRASTTLAAAQSNRPFVGNLGISSTHRPDVKREGSMRTSLIVVALSVAFHKGSISRFRPSRLVAASSPFCVDFG